MPFEIYRPEPGQPQRKQGPAKLTVAHAENGRSQIFLSAATRNWLCPTPGDPGARYPANMPAMNLVLLVDRQARELMLQRCPDDETGEHVYVVRGLTAGSTSYITGWKLDEALGIKAGHYLCDLVPDAPDDKEGSSRAVIISMDSRVAAARQRPTTRRASAQPHASLPSDTDEQRITQLRPVTGEDVTGAA
ncbi:hypothetical protein [Streptomyces sp. NPDC056061]|uniref:hypothetical protein n=1 Tax=Streptomyces sp. NPDC056061 TaxID=3345700 RepID=UPI0035D93D5A